jgi:hypothetical protein
MVVERGQNVVLVEDDDDENDKGEIGEPALLPFSQLVFEDDEYWASGCRSNVEPDVTIVLLGDVTVDDNCF